MSGSVTRPQFFGCTSFVTEGHDNHDNKERPREVSFCRDLVLPPVAVAVMFVAEFYLLSKITQYNP
jgi:hypothetical protein